LKAIKRAEAVGVLPVARQLGISQATVTVYISRARDWGVEVPGRSNVSEVTESRSAARARVAADLLAGLRCPQCHLLLPCHHG
jgi:predicted transcriptional regulator